MESEDADECTSPIFNLNNYIKMKTYNFLKRDKLLEHALTMGIHNPETYRTEPLRNKVIHAHTTQLAYEGLSNKTLQADSQVQFFKDPWRMAVSLREAGITEDTLMKLIENGIRSPEQIKLLDKETLVKAGIPVIQAAIITNTYGITENVINLDKSLIESENSLIRKRSLASKRKVLSARWPNEKKIERVISFHEYLQALEFHMEMADPSRTDWVNYLSGSLVGDAKKKAEEIISENPKIKYEEFKTKLVNQIITNEDILQAFTKLRNSQFDLNGDITQHIDMVKETIKILCPDIEENPVAVGIILMLTIPSSVCEEIVKGVNYTDLGAIEDKIIEVLEVTPRISEKDEEPCQSSSSNSPPSSYNECSPKRHKEKLKQQCANCKKIGHSAEGCWLKNIM